MVHARLLGARHSRPISISDSSSRPGRIGSAGRKIREPWQSDHIRMPQPALQMPLPAIGQAATSARVHRPAGMIISREA